MKIDTHRHFGGSISTECVWDIIRDNGMLYLAGSLSDVESAMVFSADEKPGFNSFLNKFRILDNIKWSEELIDLSVKSVCDGLEDESIDYCWMDFSINKYMNIGWHKREAIKFMHDRFHHHRPNGVGLILSLKYEDLKHTQREYAELIDDPISELLFGIDVVGDETFFDAEFYSDVLRKWVESGKMVRMHVGESQSDDNIKHAIIDIGVTNIAHGIKIGNQHGLIDHSIVDMAVDKNITFDMAITSNYLTGCWTNINRHPSLSVAILKNSYITIGSDDPVILRTTLENEFAIFKGICDHNKCTNTDGLMAKLERTAINNTNRFK